jgi:hypothetical protein
LNRRRFLKYAGAAAVVVGGSALGVDYLLSRPITPTPTRTSTPTTVTTPTPPTIENLKWTPTKVVNGKVYEGTVSFEAQGSNSSVVQAELTFDPVYPQGIPTQAFTVEPSRSYSLSSNAMTAHFSQAIPNLVGGRKYRAQVILKDQYGGQVQADLDVPYVREFENITKGAGVNIGAYYSPWYSAASWDKDTFLALPQRPLLGAYDSQDQFIVSKHIDWSTGCGIGSWLTSWEGPSGVGTYKIDQLFSNPLSEDIKVGISYITDILRYSNNRIDLDDKYNADTLAEHMEYFARNYFPSGNYWMIDGKAVVHYYYSRSFVGDLEHVFGRLRDVAQTNGFKLFIVGDVIGVSDYWDSPQEIPYSTLRLYDAVDSYGMLPSKVVGVTNDNYEQRLESHFAAWSRATKSIGLKLIPFAIPGYAKLGDEGHFLAREPARFSERLKIAIKYMDPEIRTVIVTTFNEWFEHTYVDPSVDDGFQYLQSIKEFAAG